MQLQTPSANALAQATAATYTGEQIAPTLSPQLVTMPTADTLPMATPSTFNDRPGTSREVTFDFTMGEEENKTPRRSKRKRPQALTFSVEDSDGDEDYEVSDSGSETEGDTPADPSGVGGISGGGSLRQVRAASKSESKGLPAVF